MNDAHLIAFTWHHRFADLKWLNVSVCVIRNTKRLTASEKLISAYRDNAWRLFWGLHCPTCTVDNCMYMSKLSITAQWILFFYMLYHFSWPYETKPFSFLILLQGQNRKEQYNMHHKPSQRASKQSHGRRNLAWIMNNNTIWLECTYTAPLEVASISCASILCDSHEYYWCALPQQLRNRLKIFFFGIFRVTYYEVHFSSQGI